MSDPITRLIAAIGPRLMRDLRTHGPEKCAGRACCVHNPSAHHMRDLPLVFRPDTGKAERICPHGIGHPDPDDADYRRTLGPVCDTHGCDGCCIS